MGWAHARSLTGRVIYAMPNSADNNCPFCGARFSTGSSACPVCDLPLFDPADPTGSRRGGNGRKERAGASMPFDGAGLFEEPMFDDGTMSDLFEDGPQRRRAPLATEAWSRDPRGQAMRCVVVAINQAEADMLEDMLRSEGIPCMTRTIGNPTPPDFLAIGRREVLVPESALPAARDLLRIETPLIDDSPSPPLALAFTILVGLVAVALCVSLLLGLS